MINIGIFAIVKQIFHFVSNCTNISTQYDYESKILELYCTLYITGSILGEDGLCENILGSIFIHLRTDDLTFLIFLNILIF